VRAWLHRHATALAYAVVGVSAFALRLVPVLRGGGLTGVLGFDDGVYYGAADALLGGRLPYRDVLLLHPPGIVWVLSPVAALGRLTTDSTGLAVGRLLFMAVGAVNAVLVAHLARRLGPAAAMAAGLTYACFHPATYAERSTYLEPLVNLGVLGALVLAGTGRRTSGSDGSGGRPFAAGLAVGAAGAVKLWAAGPAAVVGLWVLRDQGRRAALRYVTGCGLGWLAVGLPGLLMSPGSFWQMVFVDQARRRHHGSIAERLQGMAGLSLTGGSQVTPALVAVLAAGLLLAVLVVLRLPPARVFVAVLGMQVVDVLTAPIYVGHYASHAAPGIALLVGSGVGLLAMALARRPAVAHRSIAPARAVPALLVAALTVLLALPVLAHPEGWDVPSRVDAVASHYRCVTGDAPSDLVSADLLTKDLRDGCPLVLDVGGSVGEAVTHAPRPHEFYRHQVSEYLGDGSVVLLHRSLPRLHLDREARRDVASMRAAFRSRHLAVLVRAGPTNRPGPT
jgi:alpha-1,2-mannosyltransferase